MALHKESYGLIYNDDGSLCVTIREDDIPFEGVKSFAVESPKANLVYDYIDYVSISNTEKPSAYAKSSQPSYYYNSTGTFRKLGHVKIHTFVLQPNQSISISGWVKWIKGGSNPFKLVIVTKEFGGIVDNVPEVTQDGEWHYFKYTYTNILGCPIRIIRIWGDMTYNEAVEGEGYIFQWQVEEGYPTSFTHFGNLNMLKSSETPINETVILREGESYTFSVYGSGSGGIRNSHLQLDGVQPDVYIPHSEVLNFDPLTDNYTIEFLMKADVQLTGFRIIEKFQSGYGYPISVLGDANTNEVRFVLFDGVDFVVLTSSPLDNQWHRMSFVVDNNANMVYLYQDGKLIDSAQNILTNSGTNPASYCIGNNSAKDRPFEGEIADIRFWNKARSQEEIQSDAFKFLNGNEANLVGYWRMDDGEGVTITDYTTNGNHGIINSGATWIGSNKIATENNPTTFTAVKPFVYCIPTNLDKWQLEHGTVVHSFINHYSPRGKWKLTPNPIKNKNFVILLWFKIDYYIDMQSIIYSGDADNMDVNELSVFLDPGHILRTRHSVNGTEIWDVSTGIQPELGVWHFLVVLYDGLNFRAYYDASKVVDVNAIIDWSYLYSDDLYIGCPRSSKREINGLISNLYIGEYDPNIWTDEYIQELYNARKPFKLPANIPVK